MTHSSNPRNNPSRRDFVRTVAACVALPAAFRDDPYRPLPRTVGRSYAPIRIRGRVHSGGKGLGRVGVTDGRAVVATDRQGWYDLVTTSDRKFVTVSVPAGYELPRQSAGTTHCFQPIGVDRSGEMTAHFALDRMATVDDEHAFLVLADIQTQDRPDFDWFRRDTLPDLQKTVARLGSTPLFGVADGDIMWDHLEMYEDYERVVHDVGIPFVQVVGNHDLDLNQGTDAESTTTFERRFGSRYYSFNRGQVHYVVLDDVFYYDGGFLGYVDETQLGWLKQDLALLEVGSPVVVFLHIPLWSTLSARQGQGRPGIATAVTNREAVYRLLEPYQALVLSGHIHENTTMTRGKIVERNIGAVCGAWWTGPVCYDGTPSGYGIFRVKGRDIQAHYQATGKEPDHQIRIYPKGADAKAPDEIVANIWSWEPGWKVVWYENGTARGSMARRTGLDPLAAKLQTGASLPEKRPFVEPVNTDHLFYAAVSADAVEIRIEATDLSGRTYTEILRP